MTRKTRLNSEQYLRNTEHTHFQSTCIEKTVLKFDEININNAVKNGISIPFLFIILTIFDNHIQYQKEIYNERMENMI